MEALAILSYIPGLPLFFISLYVIHEYQKTTGRVPSSFQMWMFSQEMKSMYPLASKISRVLFFITLALVLPYLVSFIFKLMFN